MVKLNHQESIEELNKNGLKIIQATDHYRFSIDSILLVNFIQLRNYEKVIDLGTGSGVIPLLLCDKKKGLSIFGIELQEKLANMAKRSVKLNNLQDSITIWQEDLRKVKGIFRSGYFDVVVSNPPYISLGHGKINPLDSRAIARHEIKCDLEDIISISNYLLRNKGRIYLIYKSSKLNQLFLTLRKYNIEPKVIQFIHSNFQEPAHLVLLAGIKGGREELKVEPPVFLHNPQKEIL